MNPSYTEVEHQPLLSLGAFVVLQMLVAYSELKQCKKNIHSLQPPKFPGMHHF
jgi:hypothetical protein